MYPSVTKTGGLSNALRVQKDKMTTMLNLSVDQIKLVKKIFAEFLWNGKKAKIALYTLKQSKDQGGLKLIDLESKQDAIQISWVFRSQDSNLLRKSAESSLCPITGPMIWRCNLHQRHIKQIVQDSESFWSQVLSSWCKIHFDEPSSKQGILDQIIWLNSHILLDGKVLRWQHWINLGIWSIADLFDEWYECKSVTSLGVNWLESKSLWAAITLYGSFTWWMRN